MDYEFFCFFPGYYFSRRPLLADTVTRGRKAEKNPRTKTVSVEKTQKNVHGETKLS